MIAQRRTSTSVRSLPGSATSGVEVQEGEDQGSRSEGETSSTSATQSPEGEVAAQGETAVGQMPSGELPPLPTLGGQTAPEENNGPSEGSPAPLPDLLLPDPTDSLPDRQPHKPYGKNFK